MIIMAVLLCVDWLKIIRNKTGMPDERAMENDIIQNGKVIKANVDAGTSELAAKNHKLIIALEVVAYITVFALFVYNLLNLSQATFNPFIYFQF